VSTPGYANVTTAENGGSAEFAGGSWRQFIFVLALLMVPSLFFVTGQSLWVDEANSAWFASHARGWNPDQFGGLAAVPEMPLFHLLLTGWVRVFGDSERALRAMNIPFVALFLGAILALCRAGSERLWWLPALPFAFFPLLTYYVNECRPYAALLALSTAAGCALLVYRRSGRRWLPWACCFCALLTFAMHMLGGLAVAALGSFVLIDADLRRDWKSWIAPVLVSLPGYVAVALYYMRIARENIVVNTGGVNPETPGNVASNWKNVAFFFYEALGFSGLGPPRNALRIHAGVDSFHGYFWSMLLGSVAAIAVCACFAKAGRGGATRLLGCCAVGLIALLLVARAFHFGFFGRHGMALVGLLCCAMVLALSARGVDAQLRYAVVAVLVVAWGVSSARLLFVYPYAKDDVRSALRAASSQGIPILWDAGDSDVAYYGGFDTGGQGQRMFDVAPSTATSHWRRLTVLHVLPNAPSAQMARLVPGNYVMVKGKADIFDPSGSWTAMMAGWQPHLLNRLNGFDVWRVTVPPQ
jgi:hypothetical protein